MTKDNQVPYHWMMAIHLFAHTNNYDLETLRDGLSERPEEYERLRRQFDDVLRERMVTVEWYEEHANHYLEDEATLYRYLQEVYDYLFDNGPWPISIN